MALVYVEPRKTLPDPGRVRNPGDKAPPPCANLRHFSTRVWGIPAFGAETKSVFFFLTYLLVSAVLRVRGRFQNPRQTLHQSPVVRDAEMTIKILFERSSQKEGQQGVQKEGQHGTHLEILLSA